MAMASFSVIHQTPFFLASNPSQFGSNLCPNQVHMLPAKPCNLMVVSNARVFHSHGVKPSKTRVFLSHRVRASASSASSPNAHTTSNSLNSSQNFLSDSTRTVSYVLGVALSLSKVFMAATQGFASKIRALCLNPTPDEAASLRMLQDNLVCTVGPLFFAAMKNRPAGYLNTPLTVVASGMARWLDIYSGVLMVRVLLSWFPNIPWDRQPLSAIRDLCDPYLNLFRNIIPPVFDTLDVSPILAFAVLGSLGSILNNTKGSPIY
ncbi:hypothetical protein AMTRI_Chr04g243400 [Amborella trichopoda]|uniref:YGGT family protein n=1 Tax=Amborella trichopoda TaxID=13333 RepID=W1PU27_AMBTC|nr:ylmG homolog protein 1-2, chloroplastic [Amborella trichopoda]ERN11176.1 hypothetical protein AMTR_s00024p00200150 [Amborella trichopoda]|eukprot:XP_006849595.1 ylmG homolog protein 1-2, chloroplastic [Amborella trichopoda]